MGVGFVVPAGDDRDIGANGLDELLGEVAAAVVIGFEDVGPEDPRLVFIEIKQEFLGRDVQVAA